MIRETNFEDKLICGICGKEFTEGYCVDDGAEYYCSEECKSVDYTDEEWTKLYNEGGCYWSQWD